MREFFKAISLEEAKRVALSQVRAASGTEFLRTQDGLGRILAKEVQAPTNLPGFKRSRMDGYAVRSEDTFEAKEEEPISLRVMGEIEMGEDASKRDPLNSGEAVAISTGGMLPSGADAVVMLEDTDRKGKCEIDVYSPVACGANVTAEDEDLKKGEKIIPKGHQLKAQHIGALLGVGIIEVQVFKRLGVGIISTGNELIPPRKRPRPGEVRDINSYTLLSQIHEPYTKPRFYGIIPDKQNQLIKVVKTVIKEQDILLISGGSSVGVRDMTLTVLEGLGKILIRGLQMAPGKPTLFGLSNSKPVIGLPGNPVSSMVVYDKLVKSIIDNMSGRVDRRAPRAWVSARLLKNVSSVKGRKDFVRVVLKREGGELVAKPVFAHSNIISSLSKAHGLMGIKAASEGVKKGSQVRVELW